MSSSLSRPYAVVVSLTSGRQVLAVAGFDKDQAQAAIELLELPVHQRTEHATRLLTVLEQVKPDQCVRATPTTRMSGLVRGSDVLLPKRAAYLIAKACLLGNDEGVTLLKRDLERIVAGIADPEQIRHPFLFSEGFRPKP